MNDRDTVTVHVWVTDVWDRVELQMSPDDTLAQLKAAGLTAATGATLDPSRYEVKFRGALITDENQTLRAAGVSDRAPLIILPAQRRPVV